MTLMPLASRLSGKQSQMARSLPRTFSYFRNCENVEVSHFDVSGIIETWKGSYLSRIELSMKIHP